MKEDIEQLEEIKSKFHEFFKTTMNEMPPIKATLMVEVLKVFANFEEEIEGLIKEHSKT